MTSVYDFKFLLPIDEGLWIYQSFQEKTSVSLNDKLQILRQLSSQLSIKEYVKAIESIEYYLRRINDVLKTHDEKVNMNDMYDGLEDSVNELQTSLSLMSDDELSQLKIVANECANLDTFVYVNYYDREKPNELARYREISFGRFANFQDHLLHFISRIDYVFHAIQQLQEIIEPISSFKYLRNSLEASDDPQKAIEEYILSFKKLEELSLPLTSTIEKIKSFSPEKYVYKSIKYMRESDAVEFVSEAERFSKQKQSTFRKKVDLALIDEYRSFVQDFIQKQTSVEKCVRMFTLAMKYSALNEDHSYKYIGPLIGYSEVSGVSSIQVENLHDELGSNVFDEWLSSQKGYIPDFTLFEIFAIYNITETNVKVTITGTVESVEPSHRVEGYLHGVPIKEHPEFAQYKNEILQSNDDVDPNEVDSLALEKIINEYGYMTENSFSPIPEFVFEYKL